MKKCWTTLEEAEEMFAELEERSMRNAWQQDLIDLYRRER